MEFGHPPFKYKVVEQMNDSLLPLPIMLFDVVLVNDLFQKLWNKIHKEPLAN